MTKKLTATATIFAMLLNILCFSAFAQSTNNEQSLTDIKTIDFSTFDENFDFMQNGYQKSDDNAKFSVFADSSLNQKVLKIEPNGDSGNQTMSIPLGDASINTQNGSFVIEIKAKLDGVANRPLRGFPTLSDGTTDNIFGLSWMNGQMLGSDIGIMLSANSNKDGIWTFKATDSDGKEQNFANDGSVENNVGSTKYERRFFETLNNVSKNYYIYKWVVNPDGKTFRFYYSKDNGATFSEPWGDLQMANPYTSDTTDRFSAGLFPTGTLPSKITCLKLREYDHTSTATADPTAYSIAYIKTYPYVVPTPEGNTDKTINFSVLTTEDVKDYATGLESSANANVAFAINNDALEIKATGKSPSSMITANPQIPLNDLSIDTSKGSFSIRIKAKSYNGNTQVIRSFPTLSDGTNNDKIGLGWAGSMLFLNANNRQDGMWTYKTHDDKDAAVGNEKNNVNLKEANDMYFMTVTDASKYYYTYRYDIDPENKTFRFYFQKDGQTEWIEPWADFYMINPYKSTDASITRFDEPGLFPVGELPKELKYLTYDQRFNKNDTAEKILSIKSIRIIQELSVKEASVKDGETINQQQLWVKMSDSLCADYVNGNSAELYSGDKKLEFGTDYTAEVDTQNSKKLNIYITAYDPDAEYTLKLVSGKIANSGGLTLNSDYELKFKIKKDEETLKLKLKELADKGENVSAADSKLLSEIKSLVNTLSQSGTNATEFDNYDKYQALLPLVAEVKSLKAEYSDGVVTLKAELDGKVTSSNINKNTVLVLRGNKKVEYSIKKDGDETDCFVIELDNTMTDSEALRINVQIGYICKYSAFFDIPNDFERSKFVLTNSENSQIDAPAQNDGILNISYSVTNNTYSAGAKDVEIITAVYDGNNTLIGSETSVCDIAFGTSKEITVNFDELANKDAKIVSSYVWKNDTKKPLMLKADYKKTYGIDSLNSTEADITVGFIGGSITQGGHYTKPFTKLWQNDRTGNINVINAGVGGTGSNFGAMRLYDDLLSQKPDIVFVEFTLNDLDSTIKPSAGLNVESIIRQCKAAEHEPVLVFIHIPDRRVTGSAYTIQQNINTYDNVLSHYGLKAINAHQLVLDAILNSTNDSWDNYIPENNVHPTETQGEKIAELMYNSFKTDSASYIKNITMPSEKLNENIPDEFNCTNVSALYGSFDSNWLNTTVDTVTEGYEKPSDMPFEDFYAAYTSGAKMTFEFTGTRILANGLTCNKGRYGTYKIFDETGDVEQSGSCKTYTSPDNWYENIILTASGLKDGKHVLEITVSEDKEADAAGKMFGIGEFWVDEK